MIEGSDFDLCICVISPFTVVVLSGAGLLAVSL
jgi:hypothetical protein